jgi:hypothetical protein
MFNNPGNMAATEVDYGGSYPNDASFDPSFSLPMGPGPNLSMPK